MPSISPASSTDRFFQLLNELTTSPELSHTVFDDGIHPTAADSALNDSVLLRSSSRMWGDARPSYHAARTSARDGGVASRYSGFSRLRRQQRLQRVQRPLTAERWTTAMLDDDSSDSSDEYYDISAQFEPPSPVIPRRRISLAMRYSRPSSSSSSSSSSLHHQDPLHYCLGETAVDLSEYRKGTASRVNHEVLDFNVVTEDGGRYSPHHDIENILRNDCSVYCSNRSGTINVLLRYCGPTKRCHSFYSDIGCVISRIVIKSPQHGYTAPCKEGMFFISHTPIDINSTKRFDGFTKKAYEEYVARKGGPDMLSSSDPVAWFSVSNNSQDVIDLDDRACKYVLIKLLRAKDDAENIDLQYVAFIGYVGSRAFGSGQLC